MPNLTTSDPTVHDNPVCTCAAANTIYLTGKQTCMNLFDLAQSQTANKEDLLRAVLSFACSTIDSVGKQLAKSCLSEIIDMDDGAQKTFEKYVSREIDRDPKNLLSRALTKPDYRGELIKAYVESIEGVSLQSYPQISELSARFGIATNDIISAEDAKNIFDIRQKIVHEMDIETLTTTAGTTAERRVRAESELKELTEKVLEASQKLIQFVHNKIHEPRAEDSVVELPQNEA